MPGVLGYGTALAAMLGAFSYTGGKLSGPAKDREVDEVARKMALRKNRRRPIEETVNELGEGRGELTFRITFAIPFGFLCCCSCRDGTDMGRCRCLRPRLRGEESSADQGSVQHRRATAGIAHGFLIVKRCNICTYLPDLSLSARCSLKTRSDQPTCSCRWGPAPPRFLVKILQLLQAQAYFLLGTPVPTPIRIWYRLMTSQLSDYSLVRSY